MAGITFDIELQTVSMPRAALDRLQDRLSHKVALKVAEEVKRQARSHLSHKTANIYNRAVTVGKTADGETPVYLEGWLPLALEHGTKRFDMKPGLLASPKAKLSKEGKKYLVVPIEKGTFRVVSENSKKSSWIHPGLTARNFTQQAFSLVQSQLGALFADYDWR